MCSIGCGIITFYSSFDYCSVDKGSFSLSALFFYMMLVSSAEYAAHMLLHLFTAVVQHFSLTVKNIRNGRFYSNHNIFVGGRRVIV